MEIGVSLLKVYSHTGDFEFLFYKSGSNWLLLEFFSEKELPRFYLNCTFAGRPAPKGESGGGILGPSKKDLRILHHYTQVPFSEKGADMNGPYTVLRLSHCVLSIVDLLMSLKIDLHIIQVCILPNETMAMFL